MGYASIEIKSAYLSTDFGKQYAMRVFELTEEQLEKIVGRNTKGKRVGQLRGTITWKVVVRGGWHRTGPSSMPGERSSGCVLKPGLRFDHQIINPFARFNQPAVLWSATHKQWGWIPGETEEQFESRTRLNIKLEEPK